MLELAKDVVEAEKGADPVEERDRAKEALTELFNEAKSSNTHIIVKRIVADIDDIVKKVRFPEWQQTTQGGASSRRNFGGRWLSTSSTPTRRSSTRHTVIYGSTTERRRRFRLTRTRINMDYTKSQLRAIAAINQNLQIIACAGSGKTQVISRRIVNILESKKTAGIRPEHIVAFTFTEKAAGELKDRIQRLCLEHLGTDEGLAGMYVGTIHGYCLNLLQQPPVYHFLKYSVLTEVQQRLLIDRNSKKSGLREVPLLAGGNLTTFVDSRLYQSLLSVLDEGGVKIKKVNPAVVTAADKYRALIDEKKYLDYSGMVRHAVEELKSNPKLREKVKTSVRYLVVDEYQDVNPLQEALIREIAGLGANLCVVGDDDQTIYQWRGSDVQNIIKFTERYANVKTERLNENFRSSKGIVLTARNIIEQNPDRLEKKMESTDAQPFVRGDILALQFPNATEEAEWIASKLEWLVGAEYQDRADKPKRGLAYSDMAILVRAWKDAGPIVEALRKAEVPISGEA